MAKFATSGESYIKVDTTCYALNNGPVPGPPDSGVVGRTDFVDCVECAYDCSPTLDTWHIKLERDHIATTITTTGNSYQFTFSGPGAITNGNVIYKANGDTIINNIIIDSCNSGGAGINGVIHPDYSQVGMDRSANPSAAFYPMNFGLSISNGVATISCGYTGAGGMSFSQRITNETVINVSMSTTDLTDPTVSPSTIGFTIRIRRASAAEVAWT